MNQQNPPLVSVLIGSYNHERYIEESINSVLGQTYTNIELLVIDDGSSDGSDTLLSLLSKQQGFFYERQENAGLTATLNRALSRAKVSI